VKAFAYVNAANEKEALAALTTERNRSLPLAGGMDLLALMKDYIVQPARLVNVKALDRAIAAAPGGGLRIGGAATLADLIDHGGARKQYPALIEAAEEIGTPQIRNVGTVGGNITQRPRCWYFRNEEFHCLKKGGGTCFAVAGENQYHAIFGEGPCHIVHPSSLAVPLIAYGARFRVLGPSGEREVPAAEFFVMPDRDLWDENILEPNELLTHVILPAAGNVRAATYEVRFKQSHDWPLGVASVVLTMDGPGGGGAPPLKNVVKAARVVMGAVAPIPWVSPAAERALVGQTLSAETAAKAAEAAVQGAKPMTQNAYKVQIARTAVKRAILKAAGLDPLKA
jgi:xanthine dehydrogenase YagS FAD-binding subunit